MVIILSAAFCIRVYNLQANPAGFFCDEASVGYNAYTILTGGKDQYGTSFPVFFKAFGEYKSPIEIYSTVPFIKIFGLNEFSVRITSAFYGILGILAIYFLILELFFNYPRKKMIALCAMLMLAISPWDIQFSRVALEGLMPFVLFTCLGLIFFLKFLRNSRFLYISTVFFTLALYSYFPARIFIPLFGIGLVILYWRQLIKYPRTFILTSILTFLLLLPMITFTLSPQGLSRWQEVNIFSQPPQHESIAHHIAENYMSNLSLDFLFIKGDSGMPGQFITRHSVKGLGELYIFQLPLLFIAAIYLIKRQRRIAAVILLWLLLYPVGSMFTTDESAQATRSIIGVIPYQILSAIGLGLCIQYFQKFQVIAKVFIYCLLGGVIGLFVVGYLHAYFVEYPTYSADYWGWQYGAKGIVQYFLTQQNNYNQLVMAPEFNGPNIFFQFYAPKGCDKCIVGKPEDTYTPHIKQLFAIPPYYLKQNPKLHQNVKKYIYYPNGTVAFQIGEIVQ